MKVMSDLSFMISYNLLINIDDEIYWRVGQDFPR